MSDNALLAQNVIKRSRKAGADAADVLHYASSSISVSRRLRKPEGLERSESAGLGLRVWVGQRSATVSSSDTSSDTIDTMVERAVAMAKLAPEDPYATLAPEALLARTIPDLDLYDPKEPSAEWLQEQCTIAEDTALGVTDITNSEGAEAAYGSTSFTLATSGGFAGEYRSSNASISVSVLAGSGTGMERDYAFTSTRYVAELEAAEAIGKEAAQRALRRLNPRKMATCAVPVVFDPRVSKGLLGALSGAINGSAIARGTSFLKDAMGKQVFPASITIMDDPLRLRGLASRPFDAEGMSTSAQAIVEKGELKQWFLDVRSANKLGLAPTGNATRGLSSVPSPSSSNLYMKAGTLTPAELMADIASGFYVTELFGMGVNLITGDYSQGAAGFWIEKGEITYSVSEITIAGTLQQMFAHLTPANDLVFRYGTNAPTVRVEGMTIAGA